MPNPFESLPDLVLPASWNDKELSVPERASSQFESSGPTFYELQLDRRTHETEIITKAKADSALASLNFVYTCMDCDREEQQKLVDLEAVYDDEDEDECYLNDDPYGAMSRTLSCPYGKESFSIFASALRFNYLFDLGFQKFPDYANERICFCPCSRYQDLWRKQFNINYIDVNDVCDCSKV